MNKQELLEKYLNDACSTEEMRLLYSYLAEDDREEYQDVMYKIWEELELASVQSIDEATSEKIYSEIFSSTMDYQNYKVTDFIKDEAFLRWVIQPNERSDRCWAAWLEQHPNKREELSEARWYILNIREISQNPSAISDQQQQHLIDRINKTLEILNRLHDPSNQKQ